MWYTVSEVCATDIKYSSIARDNQYHRKIPHRSTPYLSHMRIIGFLTFWLSIGISWAQGQRSIFEDEFGNGVTNEQLRQGNISFSQVPSVLLAITNNLLSFI